MFGEKISFKVVFDPVATAQYTKPSKEDKYVDATRTVWLEELAKEHTGIIVGQTWKCDGKYYKSNGRYGKEYEPACLVATKRWPFWIVYSDMNEQHLVPKKLMPDRIAIWNADHYVFPKEVIPYEPYLSDDPYST